MKECNCGFGGFHDDANPRCDRNQAVTGDVVTAREKLAEIQAVAAQSAPGPWVVASWSPTLVMPERWAADGLPIADRGQFAVIHTGEHVTAKHVASALNATPRLVAALTAVLDLHQPYTDKSGQLSCRADIDGYPCSTVYLITAALESV